MKTANARASAGNDTTGAKGWEAFARNLAGTLGDLSDGECLVLCKSGTRYFVQFAAQPGGMRAEAVSNEYLEPAFRLSVQATRRLKSLGWQEPTYIQADVLVEPPEGSPNHYVDVVEPESFDGLADLAVRTFREVFAVLEPSGLLYRAWSNEFDSVRFPQLGIKRRENLEETLAALIDEPEAACQPTVQLPVCINAIPC